MAYLLPTEYAAYGLEPDTTDDWIAAASALMDSYCRRASLNITQYMERLRVVAGSQTVRVSYLPLAPAAAGASSLLAVRARYARPRRGEPLLEPLAEFAWAFGLPGTWSTLDTSSIDCVPDTGELTLPGNVIGLPYNEVEVTYTAGLAPIPDAVKCACAQIVKNAQSTPSLNVRSSRIDTLQLQYFGTSLVDLTVQSLLRPFVAARLG